MPIKPATSYMSFFFLMIRRPPRSTLFPTRRSSDLLAVVLRLLLGRRAERQGGQLRETVDELRNLGAEVAADVLERRVGVLYDIVQQRRGDGRGIHQLLGENRRHRYAVRDVVVPRLALLAAVGLGAHAVGARDQVQVEAVALSRHGPGELGRED